MCDKALNEPDPTLVSEPIHVKPAPKPAFQPATAKPVLKPTPVVS